MSQSIAAVVTDLIFGTKISSTARSVGAQVKMIRTLDKLQERLEAGLDSMVIIDLNADGIDVLRAVEVCRGAAHRPRTIAFVSHVQAELIDAARRSGADEVMARSAFVSRLPALLSGASQPSTGSFDST